MSHNFTNSFNHPVTSSHSSSGELLNELTISKKRKREKRNTRKPSFRPAYIPELRIIKRDIRRRYPEMMQNVMNSYDINLLERFYQQFTTPTMECFDDAAPSTVYDDYHWPKQSKGYHRLLQATKMTFELFPDAVYYVDDVQVSVTLHERGSRITCRMRCKRTQIWDAKFLPPNHSLEGEDNRFPSFELVKLECPVVNEMEGRFIMWLDEANRIVMVRLTTDRFTFTPIPG